MNVAVILAGGVGSRLGDETPKQFFKIAGKTIIEHTVDVFEHCKRIDEIAIVIHPLYVSKIETMALNNGWTKVRKILKGGDERYLSSLAAINAYRHDAETKLLFHDAVRPLVNQRILNDVIDALQNYNAVDVAVPATDTIIQVNESGEFIRQIPNRKYLRRGQTPQAFSINTIAKAYETGLQDAGFVSSDDCGVVVKYLPDEQIFVVRGEENNMKLTYKEDTFLLDKLFQLRTATLQNDFDFSQLQNKVVVVFGGNSGIGKAVAELATAHGAKVCSFSRSTTGTNIADRSSVKAALAETLKHNNRIDYIINSAATLYKQPLVAMNDDDIQQIIRTNYDGMVNVAIESYPLLKASHGGLLLYTSSSYTRGRAFYSLYSSTKAAVVNFVQALAQEWEHDHIRVNAINPERTHTPMRTRNFGNEPPETLLNADVVAEYSLKTLLTNFTGQVIDVKIEKKND